jgi:hypothetical protein
MKKKGIRCVGILERGIEDWNTLKVSKEMIENRKILKRNGDNLEEII